MPIQYTVSQGDCFSSIAAQSGIPWKKLWLHPDNAELRKKRKDPNVLYPGDIVTIPDNTLKEELCSTDACHRFVKHVEPTHIKIRLLLDDQPRASIAYELRLADHSIKGTTDGDGFFQADIPPDATSAVLVVGDENLHDIYELGFGTLDPIDTDSGIRGRLHALGYDVDDDVQAAVRAFQSREKLDPNGNVDDTLRDKLKERFGQ